jgi:hypothetical protein
VLVRECVTRFVARHPIAKSQSCVIITGGQAKAIHARWDANLQLDGGIELGLELDGGGVVGGAVVLDGINEVVEGGGAVVVRSVVDEGDTVVGDAVVV